MDLTALYRDPTDRVPPPGGVSAVLPGRRGRLFAHIYLPGGQGLHPAVLLSHGYPGNEQNLDLAQALRRLGFAVMTYHYSGSWGCDGDFAFRHCLEDAQTVLDCILARGEEWQLDTSRLFAAGHSMGGFVSAHLLAQRPQLRGGVLITPWDVARTFALSGSDEQARGNLWEVLSCGYDTLRGVSAEAFTRELSEDTASLRLDALAPRLRAMPLLCIGAVNDEDTPLALHARPFAAAMAAAGAAHFTYREMAGDHCLSAQRLALAETVGQYLAALV